MSEEQQDTSTRRPGRPRSAQAERAILDATLQLLAEQGLEGVTMEAAAARAGVSKATIYRRWGSRLDMIEAAFASIDREVRIVETGNVRGDLIAAMGEFMRATMRVLPPASMAQMIAATLATPELRELFIRHVFEVRRAAMVAALRRGQERGDIRSDIDLDVAFAMIIGPIVLSGLLRQQLDPVAALQLPGRLVDAALEGLTPR